MIDNGLGLMGVNYLNVCLFLHGQKCCRSQIPNVHKCIIELARVTALLDAEILCPRGRDLVFSTVGGRDRGSMTCGDRS